MKNEEISVAIRDYGNVIPFLLYRDICESQQVDHVLRTGDWYQIWTSDGCHWEVTTIGTAAVLSSVDWRTALSAPVLAGVLSILTSIAGLPEVNTENQDK